MRKGSPQTMTIMTNALYRLMFAWFALLALNTGSLFAQTNKQTPGILQGLSNNREKQGGQFRAVIISRDRAVLSAEMAGRVVSIPYSVGDNFKKDDTLVGFDCRLLGFNLIKAQRDEEGMRRKWESISQLAKMSSTGRLNVDLAFVDLKKAEAEHNSAKTLLDRCYIKAPYEGRVIRIAIQPFENVTIGQPIIEIVGSRLIEVESAVPAEIAIGLKTGARFIFKSDQGNFIVDGHIIGVAPVIDPVSQLVSIRGVIDNKGIPIVIGITGELELSQKRE